MNLELVLETLGAPRPADQGSLPLWFFGDRAVTVSTCWSELAVTTAERRSTPLLVVTNQDSSPVPVKRSGGPWPVVAVANSPWGLGSADFGLLVGAHGPADHADLDEEGAAELAKRFLAMAFDAEPWPAPAGSLLDVVPFSIDETYRVEGVLGLLLDRGEWLELDAAGTPEVLTAIAHIGGRSIGIAASRPSDSPGHLSAAACARVNRLTAWCNRMSRPFISVVDTPGVGPFVDQAESTTVTGAAANLRAADMTKIAVVTGRAVGLGATVMGAVGARADAVLPWPRASYALTSPSTASDPVMAAAASAVGRAAREGDVMDIVHPDDTRERIIEMLELLRGREEYGQ